MNFVGLIVIIGAIYLAYSIIRNKRNINGDEAKTTLPIKNSLPRKTYRIILEIVLFIAILWLYFRLMHETI